jgi:hypothetical protein
MAAMEREPTVRRASIRLCDVSVSKWNCHNGNLGWSLAEKRSCYSEHSVRFVVADGAKLEFNVNRCRSSYDYMGNLSEAAES